MGEYLGNRRFTSLVGLFWVLLPATVHARTWRIEVDGSGDAPTIQAGIDSSAAGDTVLAGSGRFLENIDFKGKAIVVRGTGAEVSIIDGSSHPESCARFRNGEGRSSILEGFTLTGGNGSCPEPGCHFGGGIYIFDSQPTIRMNLITENVANDRGGGVFSSGFSSMSPLIEHNVISNNQGIKNAGGIAIEGNSHASILGNTIEANTTPGDGGGIWIWVDTDGTTVMNNQIIDNSAGDHGGGIVAGPHSSSPVNVEIGFNLIAGNNAGGSARITASGGGMLIGRLTALIHHNTFAQNSGQGPDSSWGGGNIAVWDCLGCAIEQNVIALATIGGGIRCVGTNLPSIQNNLGWMNAGGNGSGVCSEWFQSNGNVVDDPYFCDAESGDFSVSSNSGVITHPEGPLGAFPSPGCGPAAVQRSTWGSLKARYSSSR